MDTPPRVPMCVPAPRAAAGSVRTQPRRSSLASRRVVTLLASGTEIVCALECGEWLVGRSHECDQPAWVKRLPAVTSATLRHRRRRRSTIDRSVRGLLSQALSVYLVDHEKLAALAPDVLVTQVAVRGVRGEPVRRRGSGACGSAEPARDRVHEARHARGRLGRHASDRQRARCARARRAARHTAARAHARHRRAHAQPGPTERGYARAWRASSGSSR